MNLNASMYANGIDAITEQYGVSKQKARIPQMMFLVAYAFGCELWAPWSEEFGRWPIQQMSLFLVNIWQIPCALAPNYGTYVVCRFLGGLSTAGKLLATRDLSAGFIDDRQVGPSLWEFLRTCGSPMNKNTPLRSWCCHQSAALSLVPLLEHL